MKSRNKVYAQYDKAVERRGTKRVSQRNVSTVAPLRKPWMPEDTSVGVLDLGCGAGELLLRLRAAGFTNLTGVDSTQIQIESASEIMPDGIAIHVADAMCFLQDHQDCYDLIIAYDLLEHFTKDEAVELCEAIIKALRPGGVLVVKTPNAASLLGFYGMNSDLTHLAAYTEFSLFQLFDTVGFTDHHLVEYTLPRVTFLNWRPWHPLSFGFSVRPRLNILLHHFLYWLRGQRAPQCFEFNLEAWTYKPIK